MTTKGFEKRRGDRFIYVGDVMCSWCWGFTPTLHRIEETFGLPIQVVNGGLRPGTHSRVLDDEMAGYLAQHWTKVAEASGQPFDASFLQRRDGWRFDSEMPAIAVVAMRQHREELALPFFSDIQHAFFAGGVDVTDPHQYRNLLADYPVNPADFVDNLSGREAKQAAWKDFEVARSLGISSFPALLLRLGDTIAIVTRGWRPFDQLEAPLRRYLAESGYTEVENRTPSVQPTC